MIEANNNIDPVRQKIQENEDEIASLTVVVKKLGLEIDKCLSRPKGATLKSHITDRMVSGIIKQVSSKKIQISLHRLLKIVKPEIQQDIINAIVNPNISSRNHTSC